MKIAEAFVELRVDTKKARQEAVDSSRAIGKEMSSVLADAFSAAAFTTAINSTIKEASRLQQAVGATESVFGSAGAEVDRFAQTSARAYGISAAAARELTAQNGALFKGLGFTNTAAAEQSVVMAKLGADLAAAFGGRPEEAVQALGSALRGEFNPAERFGVSLTAISVATKAVEMGLADSVTSVDGYAKAQATLALITEQTADVQGQFAREQDTAAGKAAIATAALEDQKAKIGEQLLPIYGQAVDLLSGLVDIFASLPAPVQSAVIALGGMVAMAGPISRVVDVAKDMSSALKNMNPVVLGVAGTITAAAAVYSIYAEEKAEAKKITDGFVKALQAEREGQEGATAAHIAAEIQQGSTLDRMRELGLTAEQIARVIRGEQVPAFEALRQVTLGAGTDTAEMNRRAKELGYTLYAPEITAFVDTIDNLRTGYAAANDEVALAARLNNEVAGAIQDNRVETDKAGSSTEFFGKVLAGAADASARLEAEQIRAALAVADTRTEAEKAAEKVSLFQQALDSLTGTKMSLEEANRAIRDEIAATTAAFAENGATLDINTEKGRANREQVQSQVDGILDLVDAMVANGASMKDANAAADMLRQGLVDQMVQAGLSKDAAEEYIKQLGLTPETVETAIKMTKRQEAATELQLHLDAITEKIPPEVETEIQTLIDEGKLAEAKRRIDEFRTPVTIPAWITIMNPTAADEMNLLPRSAGGAGTPVIGSTSWWQTIMGRVPSTPVGNLQGPSRAPGFDTPDPVADAFAAAQARQRAMETRQARRAARRDAIATAMDEDASGADKRAAEKRWAAAIEADLEAQAARKGIAPGTVAWARFMRAGLLAMSSKVPALADDISPILAGIPDFPAENADLAPGTQSTKVIPPTRGPGNRAGTLSSTFAGVAGGGPLAVVQTFGSERAWIAEIEQMIRRIMEENS